MKIPKTKTDAMEICENNIQRVKTELDRKIIEQVSEFKYIGNTVPFDSKHIEFKIQTDNKINGIIRRSFGKQMFRETQLRLYNIISKSVLTYGNENWSLK
jgi:hypothetical protein